MFLSFWENIYEGPGYLQLLTFLLQVICCDALLLHLYDWGIFTIVIFDNAPDANMIICLLLLYGLKEAWS